MKRINGTNSGETAVRDLAPSKPSIVGMDVGAVSTMTSLDVPISTDSLTRNSMLAPSYRVSVWVPTVSNPPVRVPFAADRFVEFEAALAGWTSGWSLRPGLTVGMWLSQTLGWVRDESRVYDVIVTTREEAEVLTTKLYRHVTQRFDQENVLVTVTPEYSTLQMNNIATN